MEDLGANSKYFRSEWSFCDSLFGDAISEVCLCNLTISSTSNVRLIYSCLELRWCLSIATFDTRSSASICCRAPFLWRDTTCTWFIVGEIIITTHCLYATYDTTLVFVITTTIHTVSTLTALFSATDAIVVTHSGFTGCSSCETFFLCSTVELSFSAGGWDTTIFY